MEVQFIILPPESNSKTQQTNMARPYPSSFNPTGPSRFDRLAQLQQSDIEQQHADTEQDHFARSGRPDLMEQLKTLYGIAQQSQLMPEQLRRLQLENSGMQQHQTDEHSMLPAQLQHLQGENQVQSDVHSMIPFQQQHLGAETSMMQGKELSPEMMMYAVQQGYLPKEAMASFIHSRATPEMQTSMDAVSAQKKAEQQHQLDIQSGKGGPTPPGLNVDPRFTADPNYQNLIKDAGADHEYYKPGGEMDLGIAKQDLGRQVHPLSAFFKDLFDLYQ